MMTKRSHLVFICVLLMTLGLGACGKNPHIVDSINDELNGNDPINPAPIPTPNPDEPPPPPPSGAKEITLGARDYDPSSGERVAIPLPYKLKKVKHIAYGRSQSGIMCRLFGNDSCTRNRQVLFAFDIPEIGEIKKIHDVRLQANFITYGLSFDTELLCLNNLTTCSGNGIKKIPLLGLEKYVKKKWWDESYWSGGYEDVVRNDFFQKAIKSAQPVNAFTRVTGLRDFSLRQLFDLGDQDLINLLRQEDTLWFTVTDDTFVMSPTLVVYYE